LAVVYIALGSNLGDRRQYIEKALQKMTEAGIVVEKISSIWETDPAGGPPQEKFLNAVIKTTTTLLPEQLLKTLQMIEQSLGRTRLIINGPRTIDLDILFYDDIVLKTDYLTIPHPRMHERDFVLRPLKEIAPDLIS
jgi:2-amino-4-hydroxy-6-hydroxymethyldihydropteridine diphosphokinase